MIQRGLEVALDTILPQEAPTVVNSSAAWGEITFIDEPCCDGCGAPFEYFQGEGILCASCIARSPAYHKCRSAFIYDAASRDLILAFKHGGRTEHLHMFAQQIKRAGRSFWRETDYLIPVPLHYIRLRQRRFNQAALLARKLSSCVDAHFMPQILLRHKATESQGLQTSKGRYRNVQGAFSVSKNYHGKLSGKSVVLIDDVLTTGATVDACAKTLLRHGVSQVNVVTLARVVSS